MTTGSDYNQSRTIEPSVFYALHNLTGSYQPLLPHLRYLAWWEAENPAHFLLLRMLASPSLVSFVIPFSRTLYCHLGNIQEDLTVIASHSLYLREVEIQTNTVSTVQLLPLTKCLLLRRAYLGRVYPDFFECLTTLPRLEELVASIRSDSDPFRNKATEWTVLDPPRTPVTSIFPSLREFTTPYTIYMDWRVSWASRFLKLLSSTTLHVADLDLNYPDERDILPSISLLSCHTLATSLHILHLNLGFSGGSSVSISFGSILQPIFRLGKLQDVTLKFNGGPYVELSDGDVQCMAVSWPRLIRLSITNTDQYSWYSSAFQEMTRPSILAVISLAEHCRCLASLAIGCSSVSEEDQRTLEVRMASVPAHNGAILLSDTPRLPQASLTEIHLATSRAECEALVLTDVRRVAHALHRLFPNLRGRGLDSSDTQAMVTYRALSATETNAHELQVRLEEIVAARVARDTRVGGCTSA